MTKYSSLFVTAHNPGVQSINAENEMHDAISRIADALHERVEPKPFQLSKEDREAIEFVKSKSDGLKVQRLAKDAQSMIPLDFGASVRAGGDEAKARELQAQESKANYRAPFVAAKPKISTFKKDDPAASMVPQDVGDLIRANRGAA